MLLRTILHVKQNEREFFVIAYPFWQKDKMNHIYLDTGKDISTNELNYVLTEISDGKPSNCLGYISDVKPGIYVMKVHAETISTDSLTHAYTVEPLSIIQEVLRTEQIDLY